MKRTSIPETELIRLRRSLNAILRLEADGDRRSVLIEWARNGKHGIRLFDDAGGWAGMPELIEAAMYSDGVKDADQMPTSFTSATDAIAWGVEQGCFRDARHGQAAYDKLKGEKQPKSAGEMWQFWIANVMERKAASIAEPEIAEAA